LVTQGFGSEQSGVVVSQGYGDDWGGVPPVPPAHMQPVQSPIMGGGGHVEMPDRCVYPWEEVLADGEDGVIDLEATLSDNGIDFRPKRPSDFVSVRPDPEFLEQLFARGRAIESRLNEKLRRLDEKEQSLALLEARILADIERLEEGSAISMMEKANIDDRVAFHGGTPIHLLDTSLLGTSVHLLDDTSIMFPPNEPRIQMVNLRGLLVPIVIGIGLGIGLCAVAYILYKMFVKPKENATEAPAPKKPRTVVSST